MRLLRNSVDLGLGEGGGGVWDRGVLGGGKSRGESKSDD